MKIVNAKNGEFLENGFINALVYFEGFDNFVQFTASPDDPEEHGRHLYADLKAGKYGPVAPFTVTPEMLTAAKQAKHAEINAWRDAQENGNILFTLNDHKWDCGKASQTRLAPVVAVAKSGALPPGFFWTDADNIDVPMTADELTVLEAAMQRSMVLQGFKIHERQRQMKEEVDKLTDYKAIQGYIVDWPEGN
ncbi:DUF4376 domain-containing protein [Salmonella enterica subsp. enterica serovar Java]|uniref:DUF4376 domain-containing protein n=1 Tax=Salmonella enterica subsp. enterica serovar Java TaxID=224729 RepID=A0A3Y9C5E5_SALEB|nr:DUF4376 domain-containing protein [Salmonella enterica subsp. enterica serovar Java]EAN5727938.1 DUF4376 domain-containing protein [Salmonella enterica]EBU8673031.1 DUF4376 domain-containing protein [Salmonella enterica subsp. enterica serovar Panama]ECF2804420.1 DUF4376 domain-containing protein [Salmonella enterica subsp. enterica serovar Miami]ECI4177924.1 DUF4376 domain-containing protein [Salmonella enterica subsp. diarizonae]EFU5484399.1 DUF4376 domain-containing protein [Salmonella e